MTPDVSARDRSDAKRDAGVRAASLVESGMILGLGTGSTAGFAVEAIARRLERGELRDIVGIPTSKRTREHAEALSVPLSTLDEHPDVDLMIDGADEIDPQGQLIKGGGGALLWEKMVATASKKLVIVADPTKLVDQLGLTCPLPVEVVTFGWRAHIDPIRELGGDAVRRVGPDGSPFVTDEGHFILDCRFARGIDDPFGLERALRHRPGVVVTGLFLDMAPDVIIGTSGPG